MFTIKRAVLGLLIASGMASASQAAVVGPITTTTPISATTTDFTGNLVFAKFNSSLGTLTSVTLQIGSDISTKLTVTNLGTTASSGNARTEVTVTVVDPANSANFNLVNDILTPKFSYNLAAGATVTSGTINANGATVTNVFTDAMTLVDFTGSGTISLGVSTFTATLLANSGGNTSSTQNTTATATGQVTYTYNVAVVPEPTTIVLLGLGGMMLMIPALRRRSS